MIRNIRSGKELAQEIKESSGAFLTLLKKRLPEKVAVVLEKSIHDSFDKEAYQDGKSNKWKERKETVTPDRKILIGKGSGKMHRSIEVEHSESEVRAMSDVEYFNVHNEGLKAGRGAGFTMPKRQMAPIAGEGNPEVDKQVEKWLDDEMDKIFS